MSMLQCHINYWKTSGSPDIIFEGQRWRQIIYTSIFAIVTVEISSRVQLCINHLFSLLVQVEQPSSAYRTLCYCSIGCASNKMGKR